MRRLSSSSGVLWPLLCAVRRNPKLSRWNWFVGRRPYSWEKIHCLVSPELASDVVGNLHQNSGEVKVLPWCFLELEVWMEKIDLTSALLSPKIQMLRINGRSRICGGRQRGGRRHSSGQTFITEKWKIHNSDADGGLSQHLGCLHCKGLSKKR